MLARTLVLMIAVAALGCQNTLLRSQSPDKEPMKKSSKKKSKDEFASKTDTKLLGEYMSVHGNSPVVLQSVGLVTGLDGTGGDPPPSVARTELREEMTRRGVKQPESILKSKSTALVVVRAYLPPLARKGQELDIEVRLPPNSNAESLRGGWLMETRLTEQQATAGGIKEGKEYAVARGPILISGSDTEDKSKAAQFKRGVILAGGRSLAERDLMIVLRNDFRSVRNAKRISDRISERFYHYNKYGNREALASGKSDQQIELKLHPRYRDNDWRYKQVVRHIAFKETEVAGRLRQQQLRQQIINPVTAAKAALQFEAIGRKSIPFLKRALEGDALETRFHAAAALAYLGDPSGVAALAESVRDEPSYRAHALAALAVIEDTDALLALRELLNERTAEVRYGAFRALTVLDRTDPSLRTERFPDGFTFHELDVEGEPMIHITHRKKPEVVIFGMNQKFKMPVALRAGRHIMIRARDNSENVVISRYQVGKKDVRETVPNSISGIIRKAVDLGASYPDIAELLIQAKRQHNLPSRLEIDALPQARNSFRRVGSVANKDDDDSDSESTDLTDDLSAKMDVELAQMPDDGAGRASVVDARKDTSSTTRSDPRPTLRERMARMFGRSEN